MYTTYPIQHFLPSFSQFYGGGGSKGAKFGYHFRLHSTMRCMSFDINFRSNPIWLTAIASVFDRHIITAALVSSEIFYARLSCITAKRRNNRRHKLDKSSTSQHRRSQGVQWVHLHPPGRKKIIGVIYRENL